MLGQMLYVAFPIEHSLIRFFSFKSLRCAALGAKILLHYEDEDLHRRIYMALCDIKTNWGSLNDAISAEFNVDAKMAETLL
uniref:Ribonucleoside-diphosphate reductase n=1 Tax=Ascaris lumbricoides TaxID=6252 RepID=A0A0M3ICY4_ASCLU